MSKKKITVKHRLGFLYAYINMLLNQEPQTVVVAYMAPYDNYCAHLVEILGTDKYVLIEVWESPNFKDIFYTLQYYADMIKYGYKISAIVVLASHFSQEIKLALNFYEIIPVELSDSLIAEFFDDDQSIQETGEE